MKTGMTADLDPPPLAGEPEGSGQRLRGGEAVVQTAQSVELDRGRLEKLDGGER